MEKIKTLALNRTLIPDLAKFSLLLAITILAPLANQQLITGTIVNAVLFISCLILGRRGAILLALAPSIFALTVGLLPPALAPMIPFIILGNVILILVFDFLRKKNFWLGVFSASFLKFIFLAATSSLIVNIFFKKEIAQSVAVMTSWPQLLTAVLGGSLAYFGLRFFKKIDAK
jgi:riboflavin transporter